MDLEKMIFTIISYSGDAKNLFMEAIKYAKNNDNDQAEICFKRAGDKLYQAHLKQTELIKLENNGEKIENSILLTHGQDHLMTASLLKDLAREIIDLHQKLNN
ncbi:PTS system cellobiose-specific IIA component [Halanaerobium saccharolyticum]|uniref:PTS system cellobiose-specific IIA component n=1 Tax=Halanaerobium saccharolyticum TaxID=43595 RepID=A0A4R6LC40_9FIRM|nr:PTS lactose/cellobiose transporter subunit IIA [Halanaerobium saccharolyticum]TDO71341.1 PTS system cellobiose-specific IIA component [Halanaerobium saccharolyticum]